MDWSMNFVGRWVAQPAPTWSLDWAIWWSGKHATLLAATVLTAMSCMLRQHKTWVQTGGLMEITRNSMCKHIKVAVCVYAYACVYIYITLYTNLLLSRQTGTCMTYAPLARVVNTEYRYISCLDNPVSDVHWCSCVACSSCRTSLTKRMATWFFARAKENAQHSCASVRNILWWIMPSLLHSELGAGHACLPDGSVEVCGKPARYREWLALICLGSRSAPPATAAASTPCHAENIFGSGNGGHRYTWLIIEKGESCSSSWGSVWEVEFKQTNPINRQIAHLHIYVLLAKLKPGIMLTGTSKAPQKRALVHRSVAQGRKIAGRCRWSCKSIRSGLGQHWHERRPLYWSALVEIAAPCCPWIFSRIQLRFCANSNNRRSIENIQPIYIYTHNFVIYMYIRTYIYIYM